MRSAVVVVYFCAIAAVAGAEHRSRELNGVTATFSLLNPSLKLSQPLRVAFSLQNVSGRPVVFRYAQLLEHVDVFGSHGEKIYLKMGAPTFESPAADIRLKSGETFRRIEKIPLSVWYDLPPGDYYLIFRYDLRLLPDPVVNTYRKKLHSDDWVIWDWKKYWFSVHR
jgi:hypothetical protein